MMKLIAIVVALACISQGAFAEDQATPSPTPVYRDHLARPGSLRRVEQANRRRDLRAGADAKGQTRAQAKANRQSTATTQAQARQAARAREQAQRQVAAENRVESRNATPHLTSDLMTRMGFSEQQIAAQKAREQPTKSGTTEIPAKP
ncbi:MAG: hypothetical protein ABIR29_12855 [Chthoniobacterales bacterium]